MNFNRRMLLAALPLSLLFSTTLQAAPKGSWDGTWRGSWGGSRPMSITIARKRVVSFEYQGVSTPVKRSRVTRMKVTYGDNGVTVILTRTGETTGFATLHSPDGDATSPVTRE